MILSLVISAIILGSTLLYASHLDIKDRRIPAEKWRPMLIMTIPLAALTFYLLDQNFLLLLGYLALSSIFLYALYIEETPLEKRFGHYILLIIAFGIAISWFFSSDNPVLILLYLPILAVLAVLALLTADYANVHPKLSVIKEAYPIIVLPVFSLGSLFLFYSHRWGIPGFYLGLMGMFCTFFYVLSFLRFFGGADAWALIFISISIPLYPIKPLLDPPLIPFFPFSVFVNAVVLNIVAPVGVFFWNVAKRNRAPVRYLFLGFPVPGDRIERSFGFIMEDIQDQDGQITRRFLPVRRLMGRMIRGEDRKYTKDIRLHPENYTKERELYRRAGEVWIVYGVPFLVPITAGFFSAFFIGDIFYYIFQLIAGV